MDVTSVTSVYKAHSDMVPKSQVTKSASFTIIHIRTQFQIHKTHENNSRESASQTCIHLFDLKRRDKLPPFPLQFLNKT